ncbi:MAG: DNA repair protein RecN [Lysobacterales bacterium]
MLRSLYVKDFAIVGEVDLAIDAGLTVVTGETGAGKSLLVDALLLLSGARADAAVVRAGCERAELAAEFFLGDAAAARAWLAENELDDGDSCQLRRVIRAEGASRAFINGRPATLAQLGELATRLIGIHGQHEHQALLDRAQQLALLDAFGGHAEAAQRVAALARRWREAGSAIARLAGGADHAERLDWLEHQLNELDRHALGPEDLAALEERHRRLANAGQLLAGSAAAAEAIDGDSEFALLPALGRAQNEMARLAELDPRLAGVAELVDAAQIQLGEAADALARYRDALDLDPDALAECEAQLAKLHELGRKHRVAPAGLKQHADALRAEQTRLRDAGSELLRLERERAALTQEYAAAAQTLRQAREAAAQRLSASVSALLGELGMGGGRFEVALEPSGRDEPDALGSERAEFLVSANPGQAPRALRKVASGGELSRISLAIEVAALGLDDVPTLVFDEVDAGIGGAVAEVVGQKLRALGASRQVLCVTHLAQVAAQGHQHLKVEKSSDGIGTANRVLALGSDARRDEIARMLGGIEITRETRAHAASMLKAARS